MNPGRTITVVGHADEKGNSVYNQRLSEKRAAAVRNILVQFGVQEQNIVATGKGETEPINNNSGTDADIQNRRVQIIIQE